jgi:hypothetical protein
MGYPVKIWDHKTPPKNDTLYCLRMDYEESEGGASEWAHRFRHFLSLTDTHSLVGLVVGIWSYDGGGPEGAVEAIVAARHQLPNLKGLFFGDIPYEDTEISWITQGNMTPLFLAYPGLEHFVVRGGNNLSLGTLNHAALKSLVVQTGGLNRAVLHEIARATLPELEHLEVWMGDEGYGANSTIEDIRPLLQAGRFPKLKRLGLCNCEYADEIAAAVVASDILTQLEVLDLSLGILSDIGAEALLQSPLLLRLKKLDIHHHFCSDAMMAKLQALAIEVDVSDQKEGHQDQNADGTIRVWRFVAVSE